MTLKVPDVGEIKLLSFALGVATPGNQTLKLFVSNTTPADADTAGTYTEMSTQGYASKTLTKTSWTVSTISNVASATYAQQTWTFDGTGGVTNVYGYYIIDSTTSVLLYAERFAAGPYAVTNNGDIIRVTPVVTLSTV